MLLAPLPVTRPGIAGRGGRNAGFGALWRKALPMLAVIGMMAAEAEMLHVIDDRSSGTLDASGGGAWRLVTDGVMGGVSQGALRVGDQSGRNCLSLTGQVLLANNGGFVQAALDLPDSVSDVAGEFDGVLIDVYGNGESYGLHLRTRDLALPWQSFRGAFKAEPDWHTLRLPFSAFEPYRTSAELDPGRLRRIGLVAIGREFAAALCLGRLALYRDR